jgi:transcriptional regulator with XRE-family HTH domain
MMPRRPASPNAKALYAFLEREWAAMGIRPTAWCRRVGIADATILRWRDEGCEPDVATLKRVAAALERPLIDVLIGAEYITPSDAGGYEVPDRTYDIADAIRLDPRLSDGQREAYRSMYRAFELDQLARSA